MSFNAKMSDILPKKCSPELDKKSKTVKNKPLSNMTFNPFAGTALQDQLFHFLACGVSPLT